MTDSETMSPGVAVTYRIVTSVGDGVGSLLGFFAEKRLARRSAGACDQAAKT